MKKFRELKIETSLFSNIYSEFNQLASDLEYTSEIFIRKFKYKLTLCQQDRLNFEVEFSTSILILTKRYLSIYKQM